jgi:hypothetical protein
MPKFAAKLTDLQKITIREIFSDNDSILNKSIDIPLEFNSKYNTNYLYKYLLNRYLKLCSTDKIRAIDSISSLNTLNNEDNRKLEILKDKFKSRPSKRK